MINKFLVLTLLGLSLVGCNAVYTKQPVGETPKSLTTEVSQWEGTWVLRSTAITVKVKDAAQGILSIGWVEKTPSSLKQHMEDVYLRDVGSSWSFASVKDEDKPGLYIWGRIKRQDQQIFLWGPNLGKFRELVKAGTLPGALQEEDILLGNLGAKELKIISSDTQGVLYEWAEPIVLTKLGS